MGKLDATPHCPTPAWQAIGFCVCGAMLLRSTGTCRAAFSLLDTCELLVIVIIDDKYGSQEEVCVSVRLLVARCQLRLGQTPKIQAVPKIQRRAEKDFVIHIGTTNRPPLRITHHIRRLCKRPKGEREAFLVLVAGASSKYMHRTSL
mmetsp:Transcript_31093/g.71664  ORF Transcript_31093/g.71664 Transcript_31093/m.71664 type:complete len:147 (+) Transcript_31093:591-1031(+)